MTTEDTLPNQKTTWRRTSHRPALERHFDDESRRRLGSPIQPLPHG